MTARLNILYVAPWVIPGGSDKGTVDWFRTIDRDRFGLHLVTTNRADNNAFVVDIEPHASQVWNLPDLLDERFHAGFVLDAIERWGIDVLHVMNSQLGFDLIPFVRERFPQVAIVVQQHAEEHDASLYVRYVASRYGHLVDAYSATSEDLKRRIAGHGVDPQRITVIYTGIDAEGEWVPAGRPARATGTALQVVFPGRLEDQKDPELMVDVVAELRRRGTDVIVDVVGDGSLRAALEARVAAAGLQERIRFHGVRYDMADWYQRADAMLMTSRFEGIPYVIFEALAMALPVVVPDVNANAELVDGEVGFLIADRTDVGAYADALAALADDDDRCRALGAAARRRMLERFPLAAMATAHETLYERVLSRASTRGR
ncbi:MAG: glycosyltransferase family 4 protein [Acidimicrobiales bacterium]|nr:glycosyltransferase family 4 protein [Acidimicrobiales bacterium]